MKTSEARQAIAELVKSGKITEDDGRRRNNQISQINTGSRYGNRLGWKRMAELRAIWATV